MSKTSILWTERVWNPITGCNKVSPGCSNCYAEKMSKRLKAMGQKNYINGFELTLHPDSLDLPKQRKKPSIFFVNSVFSLAR